MAEDDLLGQVLNIIGSGGGVVCGAGLILLGVRDGDFLLGAAGLFILTLMVSYIRQRRYVAQLEEQLANVD